MISTGYKEAAHDQAEALMNKGQIFGSFSQLLAHRNAPRR
jgi:hypothetical protein